jgi:hypothetical protein
VFKPDKSVGSVSDVITTINIPLIAGVSSAVSLGQSEALTAAILNMTDEPLVYVQESVDHLLFNGYTDPLVSWFATVLPQQFPAQTYAVFNALNNTDDGLFTVYRGNLHPERVGQILYLDHSYILPYWTSDCSDVGGTDGTMFEAGMSKVKTYEMFQQDMYRTSSVEYLEDDELLGITVHRYDVIKSLLYYGDSNPDNWCYCFNNTCPPSGFLNLTSVWWNSSMLLSFSNCFTCDQSVIDQTIGMDPFWRNDKTYLLVEPYTGITLGSQKHLQVNVDVYPHNVSYQPLTKLPKLEFPVLWYNETSILDVGLADELKKFILNTVRWMDYVPMIIFPIGAASGIAGVFICALCHSNVEKE